MELGSRPLPRITQKSSSPFWIQRQRRVCPFLLWHMFALQLAAVFAMACGDGLIRVNPTNGLVTPKCQKQPDKRVITREDILRAQLVLRDPGSSYLSIGGL